MTVSYILLVVMTYLGAQASVFFKKASEKSNLKEIVFSLNLYIGGGLYLLAALLNVYVLRFLEYSKVLPLTSITYVWTLLLSYLIFKEKIGVKKIMGVALIVIGASMVALKI